VQQNGKAEARQGDKRARRPSSCHLESLKVSPSHVFVGQIHYNHGLSHGNSGLSQEFAGQILRSTGAPVPQKSTTAAER
jgi:hypothetical protein